MTNGGLLTADQILAADDLKTAYVACPEWGGSVKVRAMTNAEATEWQNLVYRAEQSLVSLGSMREATVQLTAFRPVYKLVGWCAIDERGKRLFSDEQIERLGTEKSNAPVERCARRIIQLSGITEEAAESVAGESAAEGEPAQT